MPEEQIKDGGRKDAKYQDLRYMSKEAEWFLAGLLEGLPRSWCFPGLKEICVVDQGVLEDEWFARWSSDAGISVQVI